MGDPDPDVLWRLDKFYVAIGLCIEQRTGVMTGPMMKPSRGLRAGGADRRPAYRAVEASARRPSLWLQFLAALAAEGEKLVAKGVEAIEAHPEVARA